MGESCPVCCWEVDIYWKTENFRSMFTYSVPNGMSLYQAQETYQNIGCCSNQFLNCCRPPLKEEIKDNTWLSIQSYLEQNTDSDFLSYEIKQLAESLKQIDAEKTFINFKYLDEVLVLKDDILPNLWINNEETITEQLFLKALFIALVKKDALTSKTLFIEAYNLGLHYYISWSIMLYVLLTSNVIKDHSEFTDILIDIEINNYFGMNSLKSLCS